MSGKGNKGRAKNGLPQLFFEAVCNLFIYLPRESCIEWPFATYDNYGVLNLDGKTFRVPRLVLERTHGAAPSPLHVAAHAPTECHNPACINPYHLRWATPKENRADQAIDGTSNIGERNGAAKLTTEQVTEIRNLFGSVSSVVAGSMYGVAPRTVRDIWNNKTWVHA